MPNATCFPVLGKLAYSWGRTPVLRPSTSACSRSDRAGSSARGGAHPFRKLAVEATDNGLLTPELAAGIARVKSAKSGGDFGGQGFQVLAVSGGKLPIQLNRIVGDVLDCQDITVQNRSADLMAAFEFGD